MSRRFMLCCLLLLLVMVIGVGGIYYRSFCAIEIRNTGSVDIEDIHLDLHGQDGQILAKKWPRLKPGRSVKVRHRILDSEATLVFRIGARRYEYDSGTIDLWTGESWILKISDDGGVSGSYSK